MTHRADPNALAGRVAASAALLVFLASSLSQPILGPSLQMALRQERSPAAAAPDAGRAVSGIGGEFVVSAYGGAPYTLPSNVRFLKSDGTDFTANKVVWDGKPFTEPVYYGARVAKWMETLPFGVMLDFTHAKAIADRTQQLELTGTRPGMTLPQTLSSREAFTKLEFSHGHNTLILNGLYRLPFATSRIQPYVGIGAGIALPHTEIQYGGQPAEQATYEYQYAGPVVQVLGGVEFRLPTAVSLFAEYKFGFSWYDVPLTERETTWLFGDLAHQYALWSKGEEAPGGHAVTNLATNHFIGGVNLNVRLPAAAGP